MLPTTLTLARTHLALLAPLALFLAPRAGAADETDAPPTRAERDDSQRALRRIVHLRSGTTVRAVTRRGEDGWEIKRGGDWTRIPLAAVERVALEKEVEREWKTRWSQARRDLDSRAALGGWSLENGLLEEGLGTLERVLEDHPDHPVALEAMGAHAHRFSVPRVDPRAEDAAGASDELRRWAAGRGLTSRELAILELARLRDREALQATLAGDLFVGSFRLRSFAAHALRRLFPGQEVQPLVHRAVLDGSDQVREQAAYALRDTGRVGVIVPVARALESSHHRVRTQAAEALGNMGYGSAVEPLMMRLAAVQDASGHNVPHSYVFFGRQFAYIQDFDVQVAQFQAVADPQVNILIEGSVLEAGVHGVKEVAFATEGRAIRRALNRLTGADPGNSNRAWLRWWEENADQWRAAKLADTPPTRPATR